MFNIDFLKTYIIFLIAVLNSVRMPTLFSVLVSNCSLQFKIVSGCSINPLTRAPIKDCSVFRIKRCTTTLLRQSVLQKVYISICVNKMTIARKAVRTVQTTLCFISIVFTPNSRGLWHQFGDRLYAVGCLNS